MGDSNSDRYGTGIIPVSASDHCAITVVCAATRTVAEGKFVDGEFVNLCKIPAGHQVVGLTLFSEDLDAGTALVFDVGLRDAADTALETVFVSGSTLGQAGGTLAVPATTTMFTTAPAAVDKILSIEITTDAGTIHAATRKVGAVVTYVPKR